VPRYPHDLLLLLLLILSFYFSRGMFWLFLACCSYAFISFLEKLCSNFYCKWPVSDFKGNILTFHPSEYLWQVFHLVKGIIFPSLFALSYYYDGCWVLFWFLVGLEFELINFALVILEMGVLRTIYLGWP
jgi:hypothetical protein